MFLSRNRQQKRPRRPSQLQLTLEVLEDRTLLSTTPTTLLDLNGLSIDPSKFSATDILVRFQEAPGTPHGPAIAAGTTLGGQLPLAAGYYQVDLGKGMTVAKALAEYKAEKGVLSAEPDYQLTVSSVPNDPLLSQQWALNNTGQGGGTPGADIHAEQAWSVTTGSPNVVVAVLDTGVDYDNPDLAENIWINQADIPAYWYTKSSPSSGYNKLVYKSQIKTATPGIITFRDLNNPINKGLVWDNNGDGRIDAGDLLRPIRQGGWIQPGKPNDLIGWNYVNNNDNPMDYNGHGTNVAGILGAIGNNGIGVAGVDWNVQIMPVEFMGANGYGSVSNFIDALNYAVQHGAKITNNSWEGAPYSQALYDAFLNAQQHGVISVAAAGNEGSNNDSNPDYPASFGQSLNSVVAVAATTNTDQLAPFSNYGPHSVELAAPGVNILSTMPGGKYMAMSGTSMAAPEVSGAMALVWGLHPSWSYIQVIDQVLNTTDKLPSLQGKVETGGRLDVAAAVGWNLSTRTTPAITDVSVQGPNSESMNGLELTFNEPIDVSTFSNSSVTLTNPNGVKIPVYAHVVGNSGDRKMYLSFANQTMLGAYHLSVNSSVHDLMGVAMTPYQTDIRLQDARTYTNNTAETIKPKSLTTSTITLPSGVLGNLSVGLNVSYPDDGALYIYLISPTGKIIALDYNRGGSGANLTNTVFTEQASTPIAKGKAPFSGAYLPEASLNQLIGTDAAGPWRLAIYSYGTHYGTLYNWSLTVTPTASISAAKATTPASTTTTKPSTNTPTTTTYSNNTAETIRPKSLTLSSIKVPSGATVGNIEVRLNVSYPNDRDLSVYLLSPTGKTIALDYNRGSWSANLTNTVFSEQAKTPIADAKAPFSGTYKPEQSLNELVGSKAGGTWRLAIRNYGNHYGTLHDWSLMVTPQTETTAGNMATQTHPLTTATKTYSNSRAESIKPKSLTVSSVAVPAGADVRNIEVRLNAQYPDDRDLYVYLISPTGRTIALDYNRGGWSANLTNTVFSEQAKTPIADAKAPFSGTYKPEQSLNELVGSKAGGTWRLAIRNYGDHYGTLNDWSLILTSAV
jgi:subtilisin family serine protease/subtilisin-like proprotein convertase family protein